jgi:hypothetical protein
MSLPSVVGEQLALSVLIPQVAGYICPEIGRSDLSLFFSVPSGTLWGNTSVLSPSPFLPHPFQSVTHRSLYDLCWIQVLQPLPSFYTLKIGVSDSSETLVPTCTSSGVARCFERAGRVVTMAALNRYHQHFKKSQLFIRFPCIWFNNLKSLSTQNHSFRLCGLGRRHHSSPRHCYLPPPLSAYKHGVMSQTAISSYHLSLYNPSYL